MWSLPDIRKMNENAVAFAATLEKIISTGEQDGRPVECEYDYDDHEHEGEVYCEKYYDIFSDVPKGFIARCEYHRDREGTPEGYFYCDQCERLMVENYTWERYSHITEAGEEICLNCHAENIVSDESQWIRLTKAEIAAVTFVDMRNAPHCIAVSGPIPEGLELFRNIEMDGSTGGRLTGFSSCESGPDGAVRELKEHLEELRSMGVRKAILILDGAYQFSVSVGIYIPAARGKRKRGHQ